MMIKNKGVLDLLKVQEIRELIKLIDDSAINEFEYEVDGAKISMKKGRATVEVPQTTVQQNPTYTTPQPVQLPSQVQDVQPEAEKDNHDGADAKTEVDPNLHKIESPMVGTYYSSPSPDVDAYVQRGSRVGNDSVVCIVEAMKLFNEIEADVKGEIVEVLVENGQLVEYGQPLFLVKTE